MPGYKVQRCRVCVTPALVLLSILVVAIIIAVVVATQHNKKIQPLESGRTYSSLSLVPQADEPVLVVEDFNHLGGFFWNVWGVLNGAHLARLQGMVPVVWFSQGLYHETRPRFVRPLRKTWKKKYGYTFSTDNWFENYFEPLSLRELDPQLRKNKNLWRQRLPVMTAQRQAPGRGQVFRFNRTSQESVLDPDNMPDYGALARQFLVPRPHVQERYARLVQPVGLPGRWPDVPDPDHVLLVAVHYRGTDKFAIKDSTEDYPLHYEYEFCLELLDERLHDKDPSEYLVLVASDEQPFLDAVFERYGDRAVASQSLRAAISTSGMVIDSYQCTDTSTSAECRGVQQASQQAVHMGFQDKCKYTKGEDVLVDAMLLSNAHVFFRSRGNVSNFVEYLQTRPGKMEVVDMTAEYEERNPWVRTMRK